MMDLLSVMKFESKTVFVLGFVLCIAEPLVGLPRKLYAGDSCDDGKGICKELTNCPSALALLQRQLSPVKVCSFVGFMQIVCCPNEEESLIPDKFAINTNTSITKDQTAVVLINRTSEACSTRPFEDMKMEGSRYLPWNKCVEFSQQMYDCRNGSYMGVNKNKGCQPKGLGERIIGGSRTEEMEFPHMALLGYAETTDPSWLAGGTLISELFVLTAAHVLHSRQYGIVKLVCLGILDRKDISPESIYQIVKHFAHPKYSHSKKCYNDIALVQLNRKVQFSERIRPACLPSPPLEHYTNNSNNEFLVTGWGVTDPMQSSLSEYLRKATLTEFEPNECFNINICTNVEEWNNQKLLCAGSRMDRKDSCQGDSGGPIQVVTHELTCPHVVVGIVSIGWQCGTEGVPAVYTRVSAFLDWIANITWPNET